MDPTTFDRLSRTLGVAGSRRAALRVLAATALIAVMPSRRRAAAQGDCPPQTELCGGVCCPLSDTCCSPSGGRPEHCCAAGLTCCQNGVTCVIPETHICCDAPCLSGGCPIGKTCCCRSDGLGGGCCEEGQVCVDQPGIVPHCVQGEPPPCPDGRPRCGGSCCGDGEECDGNGQCVEACPPNLTRAQQRNGVTAEATCPLCDETEFPCGTTCCLRDQDCCDGVCCPAGTSCCGGVSCCKKSRCCKIRGIKGCCDANRTCKGQGKKQRCACRWEKCGDHGCCDKGEVCRADHCAPQ